jgi:AmmeMemoRadiSam system protein B
VTGETALTEELFGDDDEGAEQAEPVSVQPLAENENEPIPALREVTAQIVKIGKDKNIVTGPAAEDDSEEGETVVVIEDPEGLAPKPAALSMWAYALASLFDGRRNARQAVEAFAEKFKQPVPIEHALDLQLELDKALFLYSTRFEKVLKRQIRSYLDEDQRAPSHAGTAYPSDPDALVETVNAFFTSPDGPGALPDPATAAPPVDTVRAMMLPHVDLRVGGATYAHGYAELLKKCQADLFIILGVAHQAPADALYYVSRKNFATPLGIAKTERGIAERLQKAAETEVALAELAHRLEFSVEFQVVMLSALMQRYKRDFEIVPVVCGSADLFIGSDADPFNSDAFTYFVDALRNELEKSKRKWCVLSSVDLTHVGPEFGNSAMMTERLLPPVRRGDERFLTPVQQLDASAAYAEIVRTQNARHIDGVMPVLTMLEACKGTLKSGRLLHYDQMLKEGTHSAVSYASMVFEQ